MKAPIDLQTRPVQISIGVSPHAQRSIIRVSTIALSRATTLYYVSLIQNPNNKSTY